MRLKTQLNKMLVELEMRNRRLKHLAMHDNLTMLMNRFAFEEELKKITVLNRRSHINYVLILIDVDKFK